MDNLGILPLALLLSPITASFGYIASWNILVTLCPVTAAASAYFVAKRLVPNQPGAFVAGLVFGFGPYEIVQLRNGDPNLAFTALIPWILLDIVRLSTGRGEPRRVGARLGALVVLQFFISSELLLDTLILGIIAIALIGIMCRKQCPIDWGHLGRGCTLALIIVVPLLAYPLAIFFAASGSVHGPVWPSLFVQGTNGKTLFVPDTFFYGFLSGWHPVASTFLEDIWAPSSYIGIVMFGAALLSSVVNWRSPVVRVAAVWGGCAVALSFGTTLNDPGKPEAWASLPIVGSIDPARFAMFQDLAIGILLAALAATLHRASTRWARNRRVRRRRLAATVIGWSVIVLALVSWLPVVPLGAALDRRGPSYFSSRYVQRIPPGSAALIYPYGSVAAPDVQLWQLTAGLRFRMPGGYFVVPQSDGRSAFFSPEDVRENPLSRAFLPLANPEIGASLETPTAFRDQLAEWDIRTVIAFPYFKATKAQGDRVLRSITSLIGQEPLRESGAYVWYLRAGPEKAPTS